MRELLNSAYRVFAQPRYALVALVAGAAMFVFITALSEYQNIITTVSSQMLDAWTKTRIIAVLLANPQIMFDGITIAAVASISALFGVSFSLNLYAYRMVGRVNRAGTNILGLLAGVLGVGCSACGTVLLGSIVSTSVAGTVISFLPLRGKEFLLAGIMVMSIAVYRGLKSLDQKTCPV